ncbi:hypothetical protein C5F47_07130 [Nitrosopumilus cobalaminigenes]|uniref:UspA domain-containing protein n=1 Tax=Nitrosopumilus cobalaminigenes TaxID=1470066 RepID=A0A7D5LZQ0_9ARCH|nr:universal stress protein [Nitrosopumilus cobalaminigenes]QLH03334.1 hypothetical protein C5F47_07130 [Nitrosopumilus cobalaminigenes]
MYKTILVPHAGTAAGDEALKHAIHIAKMSSSKIIILNVIKPWSNPLFEEIGDDDATTHVQIESIMTNMQDHVRKFLAKRVAQCRESGIECDGIFRTGNPANSIVKYANDEKINLIVMAKMKKSEEYKSFFKIGGTAKKVQDKSDCSILLVET